MKNENKVFLLTLARQAIKHYFETKGFLEIDSDSIPADLKNKQGTFVTLTINHKLRGCIGHIEGVNPIFKDIIENAVSAAFFDPRFYPVDKEELDKLKIEISLLSIPKILNYKNSDDLLKILNKRKPGLIIKKGINSATFLPQVWEEIDSPISFISTLCLKAGLSSKEWKNGQLQIYFYNVEAIT